MYIYILIAGFGGGLIRGLIGFVKNQLATRMQSLILSILSE